MTIQKSLRPKEVAEILGVSIDTVYRLRKYHGLPCFTYVRGGDWYVLPDKLDKWRAERANKAA